MIIAVAVVVGDRIQIAGIVAGASALVRVQHFAAVWVGRVVNQVAAAEHVIGQNFVVRVGEVDREHPADKVSSRYCERKRLGCCRAVESELRMVGIKPRIRRAVDLPRAREAVAIERSVCPGDPCLYNPHAIVIAQAVWLSLLDRMHSNVDQLGDSTGRLPRLEM